MAEGGGLVVSGLLILFIIGFIVPLVISDFADEGTYNQNSYAVPMINFVENGFQFTLPVIGTKTINFFNWFGDSFKTFVISQVSAFTYIPNAVSIPLLILSFVMLIYGILKLLPGV